MKGRRLLSSAGTSPPSDSDLAIGRPSADASSSNKEQDRYLPIANVGRIMKRSLPANAKISKEAKGAVQECASEFISFVTGEASDRCRREKRKTINGDDLLWAMTTLGFVNYVGPLKAHMNTYRDDQEGVGKSYSVPAPRQGEYSAAHSSQLLLAADPMTGTVAGSVSGFNGGFYPVPQPAPKLGFGGGTVLDVRMGSKMSGGGVHGLQW